MCLRYRILQSKYTKYIQPREKKKESMSTVRSTKGSNLRSGYFSVLLEMLVTITVHMYYVLLNYFSEINTSLF